jgi:hypothetical protein
MLAGTKEKPDADHLPHRHCRWLLQMPDIQGLSGEFDHRRPAAAPARAVALPFGTEKNLQAHAEKALEQVIAPVFRDRP